MGGLFNTTTAEAMFEHLKKKIHIFKELQTEESLIDALFPMYHLKEWIHMGNGKNYVSKSIDKWSKEEKLDHRLWNLTEFKIIQSLCNHSKHYELTSIVSANIVSSDTVNDISFTI
ncbi:hypothetical protein [Photorhabdus cinerea]|uniref:hypothetical protein n=1 Tax=Photorhabdus cinerea TaxID=471575 RepID=UPI00140BF872|nr:hypothetical protein [Photorhabdus cinerea]